MWLSDCAGELASQVEKVRAGAAALAYEDELHRLAAPAVELIRGGLAEHGQLRRVEALTVAVRVRTDLPSPLCEGG